jgi:hypothetical protein
VLIFRISREREPWTQIHSLTEQKGAEAKRLVDERIEHVQSWSDAGYNVRRGLCSRVRGREQRNKRRAQYGIIIHRPLHQDASITLIAPMRLTVFFCAG